MNKKKKPNYILKAETGRFKTRLQKGQPEPSPIADLDLQGDRIVVGVVAMHNMLLAMARALDASHDILTRLRAVVDEKNGYLETSINVAVLDVVIDENEDILKQINVE